jgi:hypothetical protein
MIGIDDDDVMRRAMAAWFRSGGMDQPSTSDSGIQTAEGLHYAVLRGGRGDGPLAVYRITNAGQLKRLKRWPKELEIS